MLEYDGDFKIRGVTKAEKLTFRVAVTVDLNGKRVSGPPLVFKEYPRAVM